MTKGTCRFCHNESTGILFSNWARPTFTDHDKLGPGDIICRDCLFWFDEKSELLAEIVGKDKPQRMRNYSHFVVGGEWLPLSKANKAEMTAFFLGTPFPTMAAIAESGQKHIAFRAICNPPGSTAGWVQFEEQRLFVRPAELRQVLDTIEDLYVSFSKSEIEAGRYSQHRIRKFGLERWQSLESQLSSIRDSLLFKLALFLAQKRKGDNDTGT